LFSRANALDFVFFPFYLNLSILLAQSQPTPVGGNSSKRLNWVGQR